LPLYRPLGEDSGEELGEDVQRRFVTSARRGIAEAENGLEIYGAARGCEFEIVPIRCADIRNGDRSWKRAKGRTAKLGTGCDLAPPASFASGRRAICRGSARQGRMARPSKESLFSRRPAGGQNRAWRSRLEPIAKVTDQRRGGRPGGQDGTQVVVDSKSEWRFITR
jgi:hypothetical protein